MTQGMGFPSAAMPGKSADAPTTYHSHPRAENDKPLGCPMCLSGAQLVIDVPMVMHHAIEAWDVGVTEPEYEVIQSDTPDPSEPIDRITAIRCLRCRWAYSGPEVLKRLVPAIEPQDT